MPLSHGAVGWSVVCDRGISAGHTFCLLSHCGGAKAQSNHNIIRKFARTFVVSMHKGRTYITLVNVYVDLLVFTRIAGTS